MRVLFAAIAPVVTNLAAGSKMISWTQINQDDTGAATGALTPAADKGYVAVYGTFDTGVYTLEVSTDGGATWNEAVSLGGTIAAAADLDFPANGHAGVTIPAGADVRWRIAVVGGTTEDVDVALFLGIDLD